MIEQLYGFLIALTVGVIIALTGYFLNINAQKQEREERAKEQLINAGRSILSELKTNLEIAKQPWRGRLVPFVTSMWESHKGEILGLSRDLQDTLYQVYVEIQMANALVQADLYKLEHGRGYYDKEYQEKCSKIAERAKKASELLKSWLERP